MADAANSELFRILVCTDTHVGYKEQDPVRGEDSMITFEEILQTAREKNVDFILHGGDLFDENKPSRKTLFNVMRKLRQYCMGDGEVYFECINENPPIAGGKVNYRDESYNIMLPFFCIHGNHDDPGGESNLAAADLLAGANLINYIGRQENCDTILVKPVLLVKGATKLALYGLGNIRDDRINRAFQSGQVKFERPDGDDWFNLFVLHQNRFKGNAGGAPSKSCVNEEMLPSWLDFVIWGHEHDCKIQPEETFHGEYFISQPGSSVATSLSQGEALEKHIGILEIRTGKSFRLLRHKLQTVRPFSIDQLVLGESNVDPTNDGAIWSFLTERVEAMVREGNSEKWPLIRLKVEHTGYPIIANTRFGQQFTGRVANPDTILLFHKQNKRVTADVEIPADTRPLKRDDTVFSFIEVERMGALPLNDFNVAVHNYSNKEDIGAIDRFVLHTASKSLVESYKVKTIMGREELMETLKDKSEAIRMLREESVKKDEETAPPREAVDLDDSDNDDDDIRVVPEEGAVRKRGRARAKARAAAERKVPKKENDPSGPANSSVHQVPPFNYGAAASRAAEAIPSVASTPRSLRHAHTVMSTGSKASQHIIDTAPEASQAEFPRRMAGAAGNMRMSLHTPAPTGNAQAQSQPWLTPASTSGSGIFGAAAPTPPEGSGADFMGAHLTPAASPAAQTPRRMPWGLKKT
eukprot:GEMP01012455.1.p1 GENE.GEMP01012455.1~~GEMP01012455.1.p1  ORF type:complete len:696 (+),score=157.37 GEMP01012455.1:54-2141(+)